jgi:hypothetical protein
MDLVNRNELPKAKCYWVDEREYRYGWYSLGAKKFYEVDTRYEYYTSAIIISQINNTNTLLTKHVVDMASSSLSTQLLMEESNLRSY